MTDVVNVASKSKSSLPKLIKMPIFTRSPIVLSSRLFFNVLSPVQLLNIRTELKVLLLSSFDSPFGIPVEANQPLGCPHPVINLTRPAVLRIYYGLSRSSSQSLNAIRPTYGPISTSSSVGMDPFNFSTKPFSLHMYLIGEEIRQFLLRNCSTNTKNYLSLPFNHCTVLVYSGEDNNGKSNSSLSFHSDCTFDHQGNYVTNRNSQEKNTCVAVLTIGDMRRLHFKKRILINGNKNRKRWAITDDKGVHFDLKENSLFVLDPTDEIPTRRPNDDDISQYVHGGVQISNSNDLSIAYAFRVVCVEREYNPISSKLIPQGTDIRSSDSFESETNINLREALNTFRSNCLADYSRTFHEFVKNKFDQWNW